MTVAARSLKRSARAAAVPPATEGICTAIVAVTNNQDSVQDIIIPGAFANTLKRLRPKLCWMHDWKDPLGSVVWIAELKPGDPRLPKVLPDGRAWPKDAGAVIATVKFNLRTQRGRDMWEHCKEWAKTGEAAFSIGYKVVDGMASKRSDGVRLIYALDLYEVSLVLHGAHNMALALEVKSADGLGLEFKDAPWPMEVKVAEPMIGKGAMVALYPAPDVAQTLAVADGNPADQLHITVAFLGDADGIPDPAALAGQLGTAVANSGALTGTVGGIGTFPAGEDGTPVWVPVDVPGLAELRQAVVDTLADAGQPQRSEHGFTPHLTLGYDLPSIEPVPPTPVQFDQVFLVVGDQKFPLPLAAPQEQPKPEGKAAAAVMQARMLHAGTEGKAALVAVYEAKTMHAGSAGTVALPALSPAKKVGAKKKRPRRETPQEGIETKMLGRMRGSMEERREAIQRALDALFVPERKEGGESPDNVWVCLDATFDTYVVATVVKRNDSQAYRIDYKVGGDGDEVALGKPTKVELDVVVVPDDDAAEPVKVEEGEAVTMRFIDPATAYLADATRRIQSVPEGKSLDGIEAPLLALLDALAVKGYDVAGAVMGDGTDTGMDDEDEDDESIYEGEVKDGEDLEPDADVDDDAAAEWDDDPDTEPDDDEDDATPSGDTVTLDPETVRAQLAELGAA